MRGFLVPRILNVLLPAFLWLVCGAEDYSRGLLTIPLGGNQEILRFVSQEMEPRHAVAILIARKGSKRHLLLEDVAQDENLQHLVAFGVQFADRRSSLKMHVHRYPEVEFGGKWTRNGVRSWLQNAAYPLVNRMQYQFPPPKYMTHTSFGTVLIVKELSEQTDALVKVLEPYAAKYQDSLKFTFFTLMPGTRHLCYKYGIWSNDELLLLKSPREAKRRVHSNVPSAPKFRLEGITDARLADFFHDYDVGRLQRYYTPASSKSAPVIKEGLRELTAWDFVDTVSDPSSSVLVEFVSADCDACKEFDSAYREVARRVQDMRRKRSTALANLTVARIDQTANEHPEVVKGTPWLKYWPRGPRKKALDVELRNVDRIMGFLEEHIAEEIDNMKEQHVAVKRRNVTSNLPGPNKTSDVCGAKGAGGVSSSACDSISHGETMR